MKSRHSFLWLALVLMVTWLILRIALTITSVALHLLWIGAIIFAAVSVIRHLTRQSAP